MEELLITIIIRIKIAETIDMVAIIMEVAVVVAITTNTTKTMGITIKEKKIKVKLLMGTAISLLQTYKTQSFHFVLSAKSTC